MLFLRGMSYASMAACWAEVLTYPLDTAKVRLQIQVTEPGQTPRYNGLMGTAKTVAAEEGPFALWGGLSSGL
jgi:solute carrier family 25 (mitochondrial uncoupling protein), member 8/9